MIDLFIAVRGKGLVMGIMCVVRLLGEMLEGRGHRFYFLRGSDMFKGDSLRAIAWRGFNVVED